MTKGGGSGRRPARWLGTAIVAAVLLVAVGLTTPAGAQAPAVPLTVGTNGLGQQGDGTSTARTLPGPVAGPPAVAIASGRDHAYLLDADGRVWAWGDNGYGQVGDGTTAVRRTPVRLSLDDVVQVEAGHYHGLALRSDGTVWTWGYGALGQLGLGSTSNRTTPTQVPGVSDVVAVAGGRDMSYAIRADGSVLSWGNNANGELGDGTTTRRTSPVPVPGLTGVAEVGAGRNHVLARTSAGELWTWGDNAYGQVGDGTTADRLVPVRVLGSNVTAVDAGAHHSVALTTAGAVLTWGRGYRGQLGLGNTSSRTLPTVVPGLSSIVEVGDGRDQSFAITATGQVWAWGSNAAGQLGDGTTTNRTSPVMLDVSDIEAVQSGSSHTVFLPAGGSPPENQAPTAAFSVTCTGLTCDVDARGSTDPDGVISAYAIDFGDGATGAAAVEQHTYPADGTYLISLTVTDDDGATDSTTREVVVSEQAPAPVEQVTAVAANTNATVHRLTIPASVQAGDALVLVITVNSAGTINEPAGVTGWVSVTGVQGGDYRTRVWSRSALAGDGGRTVSVTLPSVAKAALALAVYRGVGAPVTGLSALETVSRTGHLTPSVAVSAAGSRLVSVWSDKSSSTTTMSAPSGTTTRLLSTGSGGGRITMLVADSVPDVGTAGGLTAVADAASSKATMVSIVLR